MDTAGTQGTQGSMKAKDYTGWLLMAAALMVGALAFYMIKQHLAGEEARLRAEASGTRDAAVRVVVARHDLSTGAVIGPETMAIGEIPARHMPLRVVTPQEYESIKGHVIARQMKSGEPLLEDFVSGLVIDRFSDLIEPGHRAVSLEVTAPETYAGLLIPGDYIDLYVLLREPAKDLGKRLMPVLEKVRVIAAGPEPLRARDQRFQPLSERTSRYSLIAVSVTAAQAERIALARDAGELTYLLRNADDERELSAESGRHFFGEKGLPRGYLYYSNALPTGQRRIPVGHMAPEPGGALRGEDENENALAEDFWGGPQTLDAFFGEVRP